MVKAPRMGFGKSRLAGELGRAEAWRINRALQAHTLRIVQDVRWRTLLCVTPDSATALNLPRVWSEQIPRVPQGTGDLGQRLARAFAPHRFVAVIGADCPGLRRAHIASAFAALKRAPFALGPAEDGGFWLLAARSGAAAAPAMAGVRWSTEHAASDVTRNLGKVARLAVLRDVDVAADLAPMSLARAASAP